MAGAAGAPAAGARLATGQIGARESLLELELMFSSLAVRLLLPGPCPALTAAASQPCAVSSCPAVACGAPQPTRTRRAPSPRRRTWRRSSPPSRARSTWRGSGASPRTSWTQRPGGRCSARSRCRLRGLRRLRRRGRPQRRRQQQQRGCASETRPASASTFRLGSHCWLRLP